MNRNIPGNLNGQSIVNFEISPCFIILTSFFRKIKTSSALTPYYSYEHFQRKKALRVIYFKGQTIFPPKAKLF